MPTEFANLMQVGMEQLVELAAEPINWLFAPDATGTRATETYPALVSEENSVERIMGGHRYLLKTRGVTLDETTTLALNRIQRPDRKHQFQVTDQGELVTYNVIEIISRAAGGSTILGERLDRRELIREGAYG